MFVQCSLNKTERERENAFLHKGYGNREKWAFRFYTNTK